MQKVIGLGLLIAALGVLGDATVGLMIVGLLLILDSWIVDYVRALEMAATNAVLEHLDPDGDTPMLWNANRNTHSYDVYDGALVRARSDDEAWALIEGLCKDHHEEDHDPGYACTVGRREEWTIEVADPRGNRGVILRSIRDAWNGNG